MTVKTFNATLHCEVVGTFSLCSGNNWLKNPFCEVASLVGYLNLGHEAFNHIMLVVVGKADVLALLVASVVSLVGCEVSDHAATNQIVGVVDVDTILIEYIVIPLLIELLCINALVVTESTPNQFVPCPLNVSGASEIGGNAFFFESVNQRLGVGSGTLQIPSILVTYLAGGLHVHLHQAEHLLNDADNLIIFEAPVLLLWHVQEGKSVNETVFELIYQWLVNGSIGIHTL